MSLNLSGSGTVCFKGHCKKQLRLGVTIATLLLGLCGCASHNEHTTAGAIVDVSGNWRVIFPENASITGFASLKQNGTNVTGWVGPSPNDPIPIAGAVNGNHFVFKTFPQPGRTVAFDHCKLTVQGNRMTGTIEGGDAGKGSIDFVKTTQ